jgi:hypothetical protein
VGANHIFVPVIQIWKDLGPLCFWSHGQSFPGKVSKMKVVEDLPNRKVGQVLPPTPSQYTILFKYNDLGNAG